MNDQNIQGGAGYQREGSLKNLMKKAKCGLISLACDLYGLSSGLQPPKEGSDVYKTKDDSADNVISRPKDSSISSEFEIGADFNLNNNLPKSSGYKSEGRHIIRDTSHYSVKEDIIHDLAMKYDLKDTIKKIKGISTKTMTPKEIGEYACNALNGKLHNDESYLFSEFNKDDLKEMIRYSNYFIDKGLSRDFKPYGKPKQYLKFFGEVKGGFTRKPQHDFMGKVGIEFHEPKFNLRNSFGSSLSLEANVGYSGKKPKNDSTAAA